ncbi:hypothetical protein [Pseudalkalibacillus sp. SCS-8]|uniref:hypothetical protein n=1 Tax=Pseudalkalibacillus nanhaiensis TaxID=3115291 RepID=UPI0032DB627A
MKNLRIYFGIFMLLILIACTNQSESVITDDIQKKIKEHIGMEVSLPEVGDYSLNFINLQYPPENNLGEPIGDRHVVIISYSDEIGEKAHYDDKQSETLYGPYEGRSIINVYVSNFKNSLSNSREKEISGVTVEYDEKKQNNYHILSSSFNVKNGSFQMIFHLDGSLTKDDAWEFVDEIVKENK